MIRLSLLFIICILILNWNSQETSIAQHSTTGKKYRIGIGGIQHESNTFNPYKITFQDFKDIYCITGEEIIRRFRNETNHTGGALQSLLSHPDVEIVPLVCANATPGGVVTDTAYKQILSDFMSALRNAGTLDGLILTNHGAMVTESINDADGYMVECIRKILGPNVPIAMALDFHANISDKVFKNTDIINIYKRYPHIDQKETGHRAAELLYQTVTGVIHPRTAYVKLPFIPGLLKQLTEQEPMKTFTTMLYTTEKEPGILSCSLAGGFPYADVPQASTSVIVIADKDLDLAKSRLRQIAELYWNKHREFKNDLLPAEEAVTSAAQDKVAPVILVDTGDNIAGGTPGDGSLLLRLLYERKMAGLVIMYDPEAVKTCLRIGVGNETTISVGGKFLTEQGGPIEIYGRVRTIFEGRYFETGVPNPDLPETSRPMALLIADQLKIILTSHRMPPGPLFQLRAMGITPEEEKLIVVKAAVAWREFYEPIAKKIYLVATPGYTSLDYKRFVFQNLIRPLYPFDEDAKWP